MGVGTNHEAIILVRVLTIAAGRSEDAPAQEPQAVARVVAAGLESQNEQQRVQLLIDLGILRVMQRSAKIGFCAGTGPKLKDSVDSRSPPASHIARIPSSTIFLPDMPGRATS